MNIPKAIEILLEILHDHPAMPPSDHQDAIALGIKALEYARDSRYDPFTRKPRLLQGETKEEGEPR